MFPICDEGEDDDEVMDIELILTHNPDFVVVIAGDDGLPSSPRGGVKRLADILENKFVANSIADGVLFLSTLPLSSLFEREEVDPLRDEEDEFSDRVDGGGVSIPLEDRMELGVIKEATAVECLSSARLNVKAAILKRKHFG